MSISARSRSANFDVGNRQLSEIESRVERFAAMGTRIELHMFGPGAPDALAAARRAVEVVDDALTIHRPSPTVMLNEQLALGQGAAVDDPVLWDALVRVTAAWRETLGLFDPTVEAGAPGLWREVALDLDAARIDVTRPMALDFGGFGKGYALDLAVRSMRDAGAVSAFLSAGESSIAVIGAHPLGGGWPLSIPHPLRPGTELLPLEIEDAALSISSTVSAPGRSPMVRATDGTIVSRAATAIAVEPTGALAEAMSTALLVADEAQRERLLSTARRHLFDFAEDAAHNDVQDELA